MAGVIAKLLAAAPHVTEDDLEDPTSSAAVLASAALDGLALNAFGRGAIMNAPLSAADERALILWDRYNEQKGNRERLESGPAT